MSKGATVYAFVLSWPSDSLLRLGSVVATPEAHVTMLGYKSAESSANSIKPKGLKVAIHRIVLSAVKVVKDSSFVKYLQGMRSFTNNSFIVEKNCGPRSHPP